MAEDLKQQAEHQDGPLPQSMPDGSPRPLDKAPPPPSSSEPPGEGGPDAPRGDSR